MTVTIVRDDRFMDHDPGLHHPESPARLASIHEMLDRGEHDVVTLEPRAASFDELSVVHHTEYLERLERARGRVTVFDPDTKGSEASVDTALLAAGATIDLCTKVAADETPPGIALVRPPGHHAVAERAMGFCLVNNVAVAARTLIDRGLAERVAIYDWDVHHGNGTQDIFYDAADVFYASTHQFPFYPGSGSARETGKGAGEEMTLNIPLPAGAGDSTLLAANQEIIMRRVEDFSPDVILISAGFDALASDPLAQLEVTVDGFYELAARWRELAERLTHGRIAAVLEGGYDTGGLARCVDALLKAWDT